MGVLNGALFNAALAFLSGSTILPVFISQLTDSRVLIGLFSTLESFGWFFPQLFAAAFIAHRSRVLGFYNSLSWLRLAFFAMAIGGIFIFSDSPHAILIAFALGFTLLSIAAGFAGVAFTEIVGKTIPVNKRGSYFGLRMLIGGALAAVEGLAVKRVISAFPFPFNFGYLYISAFILMFFGLATFAYIREPETIDVIERAKPREPAKIGPGDIQDRSQFQAALLFTGLCQYLLSLIAVLCGLRSPVAGGKRGNRRHLSHCPDGGISIIKSALGLAFQSRLEQEGDTPGRGGERHAAAFEPRGGFPSSLAAGVCSSLFPARERGVRYRHGVCELSSRGPARTWQAAFYRPYAHVNRPDSFLLGPGRLFKPGVFSQATVCDSGADDGDFAIHLLETQRAEGKGNQAGHTR